MKKLIVITFLLSVTGCQAESEAQYLQRMKYQAAVNCDHYGFKFGTTQYSQCMQQEALAQKQREGQFLDYAFPQPIRVVKY